MKRILSVLAGFGLAALIIAGCAGTPAGTTAAATPTAKEATAVKADTMPLELTLLHVNDTHAKLEPVYAEFKLDIDAKLKGKRAYIELGGFPRLWAAVDALRAEHPDSLFVHAGDVFQGTLYFTEFNGKADGDFLNGMGLAAMAVGNHEFDKGPALLADFAESVKFPVLACNLDLSAEPALAAVIKPYVIKEIKGAKVALVGITTEDTPFISSPGPNVKFLDPVASLQKTVKELEALGINKIVVLSHQGYEPDKALAAKVDGVDVVIGGHSHTLIGPFQSLGLKPAGDYPTVVLSPAKEPVLVASAWQWAHSIGVLDVGFDGAGKVTSFKGTPKLLAGYQQFRVYDLPAADGKMNRVEFKLAADGSYSVKEYNGKAYAGDPSAASKAGYMAVFTTLMNSFKGDSRFIFTADKPEGAAMLAKYSPALDALKAKIATKATEELKRANNSGPGPIIADSMVWKTGADLAIMNPGGVRVDLAAGDISVARVYELQPFANTLMTIDLNGAEVVKVLEDMTDFCITSYGKAEATAYVYVSNLKMTLLVNGAKDARVKDVQVKGKDGAYKAIDPTATYKVAVNNFMGTGGDKNFTLGALPASRRYDTGFIDSEAMLDYVMGKTLANIPEIRVKHQF